MITRGFLDVETKKGDPQWFNNTISDLEPYLTSPVSDNFVNGETTCAEAIQLMKTKNIDCLIVVKDELVVLFFFFSYLIHLNLKKNKFFLKVVWNML
jgi:hypothetical protein